MALETPENQKRWELTAEMFQLGLEQGIEALPNHLETSIRQEVLSLLSNEKLAATFMETPAALEYSNELPPPNFPDFEILQTLGSGSFGKVYLAKQISLDRLVALKITPNLGSEASTMAHLEHANIVKVFSTSSQENHRCIAMQFIPGVDLGTLFRSLPRDCRPSGSQILQTVDSLAQGETVFDPRAMVERQNLQASTFVDAVVEIGIQLADALHYAHQRDILHLDVKPENVIISRYGIPMLTDFNVSLSQTALHERDQLMVGGTWKFMSPEHQRLMDSPNDAGTRKAVDWRSDIFSLGKLIEWVLDQGPKDWRLDHPELAHTLEMATDPNPNKRPSDCGIFSSLLRGSKEIHEVRESLPQPSAGLAVARKFPLFTLLLFVFVPQLIGSAVNISYNTLRIVSFLTQAQQNFFLTVLVPWYNLLAYPLGLGIFFLKVKPLIAVLRNPKLLKQKSEQDIREVRRKVIRLPLWVVVATTIGWMPGAIFFPSLLDTFRGPLPQEIYAHFFISFTLSWLLALTYSFLSLQHVILRVWYPRLWYRGFDVKSVARKELDLFLPTIHLFPFMVGFVPLVGAFIIVIAGEGNHHEIFHWLVGSLIVLGMVGLRMAIQSTQLLTQTVLALGCAPSNRTQKTH